MAGLPVLGAKPRPLWSATNAESQILSPVLPIGVLMPKKIVEPKTDIGVRKTSTEQARRWKREHPEITRESNRKYREKSRDKIREYNHRFALEHPDANKKKAIKYRENNRDKYILAIKKWGSENQEKRDAHTKLNNAIRNGVVLRPDTCQCGNPSPEGHHEDYSKPLMVVWLCRSCHQRLHKSRDIDG
jgi:hypothetical protein